MVKRLGIIGFSLGNGHPFSFSAILNGYNHEELIKANWQVIADYLSRRDIADFGIEGVKVTHAWTQDINLTQQLCRASLIPYPVADITGMLENVDGVIIARDDYQTHFELAMPFLQAGLKVFVDKPLSQDFGELNKLQPYLESGQLMSCSGMRYATELDKIRQEIAGIGELRIIYGISPNDWEKYGVHLLEAIISIINADPTAISAVVSEKEVSTVTIETAEKVIIQINNLGPASSGFKLEFIGTKGRLTTEISDNYSIFKRTLWHFNKMANTGIAPIPPEETIKIMKLLIAGRMAINQQKKVYFSQLERLAGREDSQ